MEIETAISGNWTHTTINEMELETTISDICTLSNLLQNPRLKNILSIIGQESQLDGLQRVVNTLHDLLWERNTDSDLHDSVYPPERSRLENIKREVKKANVELENFISLAVQKQDLKEDAQVDAGTGTALSKKMLLYYHRFIRRGVPYRLFQLVNNIIGPLNGLADACARYLLYSCRFISSARSYRGWDSNVNEEDVIGRESDLENVVGMLLDSNIERDVSVLSIAGFAGLGKTILAKLVYNDSRVRDAFSLRMWVSVCDDRENDQDLEFILVKIMRSAECYGRDEDLSRDQVQSLIAQQLSGERYLLVLDDVWTEDPDRLHELISCLNGGQRGSWIIITTRSRRTATAILDGHLYELQGLSEEKSWQLFQREAFRLDELLLYI